MTNKRFALVEKTIWVIPLLLPILLLHSPAMAMFPSHFPTGYCFIDWSLTGGIPVYRWRLSNCGRYLRAIASYHFRGYDQYKGKIVTFDLLKEEVVEVADAQRVGEEIGSNLSIDWTSPPLFIPEVVDDASKGGRFEFDYIKNPLNDDVMLKVKMKHRNFTAPIEVPLMVPPGFDLAVTWCFATDEKLYFNYSVRKLKPRPFQDEDLYKDAEDEAITKDIVYYSLSEKILHRNLVLEIETGRVIYHDESNSSRFSLSTNNSELDLANRDLILLKTVLPEHYINGIHLVKYRLIDKATDQFATVDSSYTPLTLHTNAHRQRRLDAGNSTDLPGGTTDDIFYYQITDEFNENTLDTEKDIVKGYTVSEINLLTGSTVHSFYIPVRELEEAIAASSPQPTADEL